MKNLEQIRAAHALKNLDGLNRNGVSKLPSLILGNGLLATAAFCEAAGESDNRGVMKRALMATADHLAQQKHLAPSRNRDEAIQNLVASLSAGDSHKLQRATAEALAYIGYLKRFAPDKKSNQATHTSP